MKHYNPAERYPRTYIECRDFIVWATTTRTAVKLSRYDRVRMVTAARLYRAMPNEPFVWGGI